MLTNNIQKNVSKELAKVSYDAIIVLTSKGYGDLIMDNKLALFE